MIRRLSVLRLCDAVLHSRLPHRAAKKINFTTTMANNSSSFRDKLEARVKSIDSLLCIGLDPHKNELFSNGESWDTADEQTKADAAFTFCQTIIDATLPYAACYKPNAAFFEAIGSQGVDALHRVIAAIPQHVPVLLDCKRGDIGSTAAAYAEAAYECAKADAVTLSPLMGWDSVEPFVAGMYLCMFVGLVGWLRGL